MSTFADFLLEFGEKRVEHPAHRAGAWVTALTGQNWRFRISRPGKAGTLHEIPARNWSAWVTGEIYSYADVPGDTIECATRFLEEVSSSRARPESLSGRFLLMGWSADSQTWNIWTDRCGGVHAYLTGLEGNAAVGTYTAAVYEYSRRKLDWTGLAGFFALGFFPQDRTYYEDCRVLRPGSHYEFSGTGKLVACTEYWRWTHQPDFRRSEADTIAEFGETLTRATCLQSNHGRVVLPLSGGLDSRTLAACVRHRPEILSFSYGYSDDSVEQAIAAQIAQAAGLPFHSHIIQPYLFERLPLQLEAVEGFQDVTQTRQAGVLDWLGDRGDFVLGGHWGDVLCDDMKLAPGSDSGGILDHLESKMKKRGSQWLIDHVAKPHFGSEDSYQVVRECLRSELNRFQHIEDADFRIKAVKTAQWAFRWTLASVRMYQPAAVPRLPFLDPRMLDFFCTVPTSAVKDRRLQVEYLKRSATDLARVRWQSYDADLFHYQHFSTWQIPRRAWKKVKRTLSRKPALRRNWEVQFLAGEQRAKLEDRLLRPGLFLHQVVPVQTIRELVRTFAANPDAANGYTVSMLLTFSAWAEQFHKA